MNDLNETIFEIGYRLPLVIIKGAGDLATGVAHRLHRAGFPLLMTDLEKPTAIRRTVAFSQAVYDGRMTVEGVTAEKAAPASFQEIHKILAARHVPVIPGADPSWLDSLSSAGFVEATLSKKNTGLTRREGRVTIALGPGYTAGLDADVVVETARGHFLGQLIFEGPASPNTGKPGLIGGYDLERLIKAPAAGMVEFFQAIGDRVESGQTIGRVGGADIKAAISGVLRGALQNGLEVPQNFKIGDIDPRPDAANYIHTPSDKARAVAGGVLEALMGFLFSNGKASG
ncbi:molybdenum hydroxylase [Deltaproteobacteria bacterium Smac51]|nr:molybdenum hydroxylase [Deltaproteobacteria bacterium Smac51]